MSEESRQERLEREVGRAKNVFLLVLNVDISVVKGKVASDEATAQLREKLMGVVVDWSSALPPKGAR